MTPNLILDPSAPQDDSTEGILLEIGRLLARKGCVLQAHRLPDGTAAMVLAKRETSDPSRARALAEVFTIADQVAFRKVGDLKPPQKVWLG